MSISDSRVLAARLQYSPPELVFAWFADRSSSPESWEHLEVTLMHRNEPLVDLALAHFATSPEVVKCLFDRRNSVLRIAALSNTAIKPRYVETSLPSVLFKGQEGLWSFLDTGTEDEVYALLANPTLHDRFLEELFKRADKFASLSDARWHLLIGACTNNPRLGQPYSGPIDGWAEHLHRSVASAVWKLPDKVPTTSEWATTLTYLLSRTPPMYSSLQQDAFNTAQRWQMEEADYTEFGCLDSFGLVRHAIVREAQAEKADFNHEDVAVRCAAYQYSTMTLTQMEAAFEKEPKFFFNFAINNEGLWRSKALRDYLQGISWRVDGDDSLNAVNTFQAVENRMRKEHSEWFAGIDSAEATRDAETRSYDEQIRKENATKLNAIDESVASLKESIVVLRWIVIGLCVLLIWMHR